MVSVLLVVLYLLTIGLSVYSCGWLIFKAERSGAAAALAVCQLLVIIWCIPQLFLGFPMTKGMKYLAYSISYVGISFIGPSWLAFSFLYCKKRLAKPLWMALFGLALLHYAVFLTNERHHLFYRQFEVESVVYGWMFYVHMSYTYLCVAGGMGAVLREFWKKQVAAVHLAVILLSAAVPLGFNVLYLSGWAGTSFDLTPLAFALSGFLMVLAVLRYDFLDVRGLAFEQILSSIAEGVAVYNKRGTFVYCNEAAKAWLGICEGDDFEGARGMLASQGIVVEMEKEQLLEDWVLSLDRGEKIRLKQYIQRDKTGAAAAGIFLLTDVGEYYERLRQSRELAVEGIRELRISINQLRQGFGGELVTQGVHQLAQRVKELTMEVNVQGEDGPRYSHLSAVVYECLREAITNCLKYAHAGHMDVILKFEEDSLGVYIFDDGQGCPGIVESNGIRGMRERVAEAKGQIRILSSLGEGFQIYIWLPAQQEP